MALPQPRATPASEGGAAGESGERSAQRGEAIGEGPIQQGVGLSAQQFAALYLDAAPSLYRYFWFHTGSQAESEDLVSETFLGALRSLDTYRPERGSVSAWLFGIARNVLARHHRAQSQVRRVEAEARLGQQGTQRSTPLLEERIDLWQAVGELAAPAREALALKFGAGLSNVEIAEIMGRTEAQVGMLLYRALVRLRDQLGGRGSAR
jgi:RNA polymerase sigma-70 factor (ECF subfamily)